MAQKKKVLSKPNLKVNHLPKRKTLVIDDNGNKVALERFKSYSKDIKLVTVMAVAELVSDNENMKIDTVTNKLKKINPINVGKAIVTLEKKGLVKINLLNRTIKKV